MNTLRTHKRQKYAFVAAAVIWIGWLTSLAVGPHNKDAFGQLLGGDYVQFYAAGRSVLSGHADRLFDIAYQNELQKRILGTDFTGYFVFSNLPFLAFVYIPFSCLPYLPSFLTWSAWGLAALWFSIRMLNGQSDLKLFLWSLTVYPVFAAISFGQNSFLTLVILSLTYALWVKDRLWAAGFVLSFLAYKPHFMLGVLLLWLVDLRKSWKALTGVLLGSLIWGILSARMIGQSFSDFRYMLEFHFEHKYQNISAIWHEHTIELFWYRLLPGFPGVVRGLTICCVAAGTIGFFRLVRKHLASRALLFASAVTYVIWISFHALIYDYTLLIIPSVLLWRHDHTNSGSWRSVFAIMWLALLVGGALNMLQIRYLNWPVSFNITVFTFLYVTVTGYRKLMRKT